MDSEPCSALRPAACSAADKEADVISCKDLRTARPVACARSRSCQEGGGSLGVGFGKRQRAEDDLPSRLKLRNLARQASSLSLEVGEGPADRDRLHDSDLLALLDVVSGAHEYFGYPAVESRCDGHSLTRDMPFGTQQKACESIAHVESGAADAGSEQPTVEREPSKALPVDARGAELFNGYVLIGIPNGNDGHDTGLLFQ